MKKIIFILMSFFTFSMTFAQFPTKYYVGKYDNIWGYYNINQQTDVNVFHLKSDNKNILYDAITFSLSKKDDDEFIAIQFYDIERLINALEVCGKTLDETNKLNRRTKRALIQGVDTLFPQTVISWVYNDTLIMSYNNHFKTEIKYHNGSGTLTLSGTAVCRLKFTSDALKDETFSGDANITKDYELVFSSYAEIKDLIRAIKGCSIASAIPSVPLPNNMMIPHNAFPNVYDRRFDKWQYDKFMRQHTPKFLYKKED